jgi:hypothetical protein
MGPVFSLTPFVLDFIVTCGDAPVYKLPGFAAVTLKAYEPEPSQTETGFLSQSRQNLHHEIL